MTSYTFNSDTVRQRRYRWVWLYGLTGVFLLLGLLCVELAARYLDPSHALERAPVDVLMRQLPGSAISGRELDNQFLVQNVALFSALADKASVHAGFVGTSRSKILQPQRAGYSADVVGAANSYGEISYGLLLQAEVLRLVFPQLRTVYVEASLLLRHSPRLVVEPDHAKYLPLLNTLADLCPPSSASVGCQRVFAALERRNHHRFWRLQVLGARGDLRLSSPFEPPAITASDDPLLKRLTATGERRDTLTRVSAQADWAAPITLEHIKVQRLREIPSAAPWDGLFELFARWGQAHGIKVIFYQPPVRSDLYAFQQQFGLPQHVQDMQRIAQQYQLAFIDLDTPQAGFMDDWSLFSDEDHLGTCVGSALLLQAIKQGQAQFEAGEVLPQVTRAQLQPQAGALRALCP